MNLNNTENYIVANNNPKPQRRWLKWIIAVILVIVGLSIFGGVFALVMTNGPVKVAEEQFADLKKGDLQAAYNLFSSESKKEISFSAFQKQAQGLGLTGKDASISFQYREVKNNNASLGGKIKVGSKTYPINYLLVKENNNWRIVASKIGSAQ